MSNIKTLEKEKQFLQMLLYQLPGNVYWLDQDMRYQGTNKNVIDHLGVDPTKSGGMLNQDFLEHYRLV